MQLITFVFHVSVQLYVSFQLHKMYTGKKMIKQ